MTKVKICGITNLGDAMAACRYGADALGFVFAKSPRKISSRKAAAIIKKLPSHIAKVGVFVDEDAKNILRIAKDCRLDCAQLHGGESINYCKGLKKYIKIIKAVRLSGDKGLRGLKKYDVDAFLLDSYVKGKHGGTGTAFDWALAVKAKDAGKPVIIAGGLNHKNVGSAISKVRPYAVDASSGLERSPGRKDRSLVKKFIEAAKARR